jgi:hypothetical protein
MPSENNWFSHNLKDRLNDHNSDFDIDLRASSCRKISFEDATREACEKLHRVNPKIYIGLSGGIDSEYVFRKFHSYNIPHEAVIVYSPCYDNECSIAFNLCNEYNIKPTILNITESDIVSRCKLEIKDKLNSFGIGGVPALCVAEYARDMGGIYIKAEHMVGDIEDKVAVEVNEWDFYNDVLYPETTYDFFMYTPEIVYSMVNAMGDTDPQTFKCNLYDIKYREKIFADYNRITRSYARYLIVDRKFKPECKWIMPPDEFLGKYF